MPTRLSLGSYGVVVAIYACYFLKQGDQASTQGSCLKHGTSLKSVKKLAYILLHQVFK